MSCEHCLDALGAYVDDELLDAERRDIERHFDTCASCARERDALTRLHQSLSERLVRYQAPDVLKARIRGALSELATEAPAPAPKQRPWWQLAAAGVIIAVASSAITLGVEHRQPRENAVAEQVLASHVRSLMPGHLVDVVSTDQHNVKPWFNGRVDLSPGVPDLSAQNFALTGGRVDYISGRPVAVVVYMRRKHVINVYSWPARGDEPMHATSLNGFHLVHWRRDGLEQWAVSDINAQELGEFVTDYARP